MEDEGNVTYITLGGHVDLPKYRSVYFVVMFAVFVVIVCCNCTVVYVICARRSLHQPMYVFIAALLVNSVLFSSAMYPKLLVDFLSEEQVISYPACLLQFHVFYSLGGSEFLLLTVMAFDRYVSICQPLEYAAVMRTPSVGVLLVLAWLVPACSVAVPAVLSADLRLCSFTLDGIYCNNSVYSLHCVTSRARSLFGVVDLMFVALLPLLFILFTYTRVLIISHRSSRTVRTRAAQTCLPHLLVLMLFSCLCAFDVVLVRLGSHFPKTVHLLMSLQVIVCNPLLNPLIYGLKMKEISKHLRRLFWNQIPCIKTKP